MRIEIINREGGFITDFELESNPFKVGETLSVNVSNNDKSFWRVEEIRDDFIIEKIEHFYRKVYSRNKKVSTVFVLSVQVNKI
jgi:hypothetical protein